MELSEELDVVMHLATAEAEHARSASVEPVHLFIAVCKHEPSRAIEALAAAHVDPVQLRRRVRGIVHQAAPKGDGGAAPITSARVVHILARANKLAGNAPADAGDALIALLRSGDSDLDAIITGERLPVDEIIRACSDARRRALLPVLERQAAKRLPSIDKYGRDYTALAREGKLEPVIGRREEVKQVIRVLLRKQKNNPILLGDAGVGKTSLVEGLAWHIADRSAPPEIRSWRIVEIPIASLVAGTKYRGDFEERMQQIIREAESDPNLILFFDEIHTLVGAGSTGDAMDAANILKPAIARGGMRCIGATTTAEYQQHIERDPALERRFQPVRIDEPTPEQALEILRGLRPSYEKHHGVIVSDDALDAAVRLSVKYIPDRRLPDKARDLLDQAAANRRMFTLTPRRLSEITNPQVTKRDIASVVAEWTGIALARLTASEEERLRNIEETLRKRVVGQDAAIGAVARVVRTAFAGLSQKNRPLGVFLFLGPSGVGKTELAKALAEVLFDSEERLLRFDMSEFMEEHSVSKLIGSPPGYAGHDEGGRLTNLVRRYPYSVVLFDEIEKAHPKITDLFLQIFDDGRLTDSHGRTADFRNTILIMTSNLVPKKDEESAPIGFGKTAAAPAAPAKPSLPFFRPELVNRISEIVTFNALGEPELRDIVDRHIARLRQRIAEKQLDIKLTPNAYAALVRSGYRPELGAREMERVIEREIVHPLADAVLRSTFRAGDVVHVDAEGDRVFLAAQ